MVKSRVLALVFLVLIVVPHHVCAAETELIVFAASSMTESITKLVSCYEAIHPDIQIICSFDSSGTLRTQIEEGAACDLFISAGMSQMDQLEDEGLLFSDSRVKLLENRVVLVVPENNPQNITNFDQLALQLTNSSVLLAMGNSDVPVGQYTQRILTWYGLDESALAKAGCITYASNVKEVVIQVTEGVADCGVIYITDAQVSGLLVQDEATAAMCGQVLYPAAVIANTYSPSAALDLLHYLQSQEAGIIFADAGFSLYRSTE